MAEVQYKANGAFTRTLMFLHDEKGAIVGVGVKNAGDARFTNYYYAKNLQGDVVAIYRSDYNSTSQTYYPTLVASYEYDPWGKVTSVKGSSGAILSLEAYPNHIAHVNPIRYRGYYYDNETGFYYLQSRYYDPIISRFINADGYTTTGEDFIGANMFAYCNNNPVNCIDSEGNSGKPYPLGRGWYYRIDQANEGTGTKRHIHVYNESKEYMQNEDGSPHDKGRGEGGPLPRKVQKMLFEKTGWDYNGNRKDFFSKTEVSYIAEGVEFKYADGNVAFKGYEYVGMIALPISTSIDAMENAYLKTVPSMSTPDVGSIVITPILSPGLIPTVLPVPVSVPTFLPINVMLF